MNENHEKLLSLSNILTEEELAYREIIPCIGFKTIIGCIAGEIYGMHPHGNPEGVPEICSSIMESLRNIESAYPGTRYRKTDRGCETIKHLDTTDLYKFLDRELDKIPEFTSLGDPSLEEDSIDLTNCKWIIYLAILAKSSVGVTSSIRNMRYLDKSESLKTWRKKLEESK